MTFERAQPFAALLVGIGLALAGFFVGRGFVQGRVADRFVTVKGVAEREVQADVALWPLRYVATDDDLAQLQAFHRPGDDLSALFDQGCLRH